MSLERRVTKLEQRTGGPDSEWCSCGDKEITVLWGGEVDPMPANGDLCPQCGRPMRVIDVTWPDDLDALDDD
jgi:hypothetical protein